MKTILLLISGFAIYGLFRDAIPRLFIARVRYIYTLETKKAPAP